MTEETKRAEGVELELPKTLKWENCPCGRKTCRRSYPSNLGMFSYGNGFEPHERAALDAAWNTLTPPAVAQGVVEALEDLEAAVAESFGQGSSEHNVARDFVDRSRRTTTLTAPQPDSALVEAENTTDHPDIEGHLADAIRDCFLQWNRTVISFDASRRIAKAGLAALKTGGA